ncbi:FMRFamide receptor [Eumeta japonica]|uniref:FMRFamide receptor n=1 Tax=Eumeta variegata TaxID=151549 RepID=A0A4C1XBX7_EUMVA|nr:FMRFamide receptor [Eumeta japonica]
MNVTARNVTAGPLECVSDIGVSDGENLFRFIVHGVLLNAIGAGGVLGNALSVLVLTRPRMRSSINCLLVGLASCDTVVILTSVLLFGLTAIYPYTGRLRYYYYYVCPLLTPLVFPLALVAQTMSVYLTLVVTIERWVAVCRPFRARALCTAARARWYVLGTAAFALLYNAPKFLEVSVERIEDDGEFVYCITASSFRSGLYVTIYIHWMYLVVMYALPFTALAALNVCIVRQVRRASRERARLSRSQRRELSLTTMLFAVVLVFFVCNLLPLVINTCESFFDGQLERLDPLIKTSNLLVMINSSVNFVIYVIFGDKFKRVFLEMFCARAGRHSPDHTRDDSFASCAPATGDRFSLRLTRDSTLRLSSLRQVRANAAGSRRALPTPAVYYPAPAKPSPGSLTSLSSASLAPAVDDCRWNGHRTTPPPPYAPPPYTPPPSSAPPAPT